MEIKSKPEVLAILIVTALAWDSLATVLGPPFRFERKEIAALISEAVEDEEKLEQVKDYIEDDSKPQAVRLYAMQVLANQDLPGAPEYFEVMAYLSKAADDSRFHEEATLAAWKSKVATAESKEAQQQILLRGLAAQDDRGLSQRHVVMWAAQELCGRPFAVQEARSALSRRGIPDDELMFCDAKLALLKSHDSRVEALEEALEEGWRLERWALNELVKLDTPEARCVLERMADEPEGEDYVLLVAHDRGLGPEWVKGLDSSCKQ